MLKLLVKKKLSLGEFFYFVLIIRKNKYRFMYWRQITPKKLWEINIPSKIPEWVYTLKTSNFEDIKEPLENKKMEMNFGKWKYFGLKDLFEITTDPFIAISEAEEVPWKYPFISTWNKNNGVACFTWIENWRVYPAWCITIASSWNAWETFYQDMEFKVTNMITILTPKFSIYKYIWLFLVAIIRKEKYRYSYGRKFWIERAKETKIKLPVDQKWNPDWKFMEEYIKSLPYSKFL